MQTKYVKRLGLSILALISAAVFATPATMQAVVIAAGKPGIQTVAVPEPAAGQVRVKVYAIGINPVDWKTAFRSANPGAAIDGAKPGTPLAAMPPSAAATPMGGGAPPAGGGPGRNNGPLIPGYDAAGVVDAVGPSVTSLKVGDEVIAWSRALGTYAEYAVAPESTVVLKPKNLSFEQAAAIPHASITAWSMVVDVANVQKGQKVLVLGGSGGVGSSAVQIAKARGAYVIATASTANIDYLKSLGVDEPIDYKTTKFEEKVKDIDAVINTVDQDNADSAVKIVKKGGILVSVGGLPADAGCIAAGIKCATRNTNGTPQGEVLKQLAAWAKDGKFKINIDKTFALAEVDQAWEYSQAGHTRGKSAIKVTSK